MSTENYTTGVKQIHFHTEADIEEVYKVLPRSCLPTDFGGELPSAQELHG